MTDPKIEQTLQTYKVRLHRLETTVTELKGLVKQLSDGQEIVLRKMAEQLGSLQTQLNLVEYSLDNN